MSIMRCDHCSALVDTDEEPEAFVEIITEGDDGATKMVCLCVSCREQLEAEMYEEGPDDGA